MQFNENVFLLSSVSALIKRIFPCRDKHEVLGHIDRSNLAILCCGDSSTRRGSVKVYPGMRTKARLSRMFQRLTSIPGRLSFRP